MPELQLESWRLYISPLPGTIRTARPEVWRGVVEKAILAPSVRNTQPWRFRVRHGGLELRPDLTRALPLDDPLHRQLVVSCGAALQNVRVEMACRGIAPRVELLPDDSDPLLLARVVPGCYRPPSLLEESLRGAITRRRTVHGAFTAARVPASLVEQLQRAATVEGASFERIGDEHRPAIASLAAEAMRRRGNDAAFRGELAYWLRAEGSDGAGRGDGIPVWSLGLPRTVGSAAISMLRHLPWGMPAAVRERRLAMQAPALVMLSTARDGVRDWLTAGLALQRVLLLAAAHGISAGYLNQVIAIPALRERLRDRLAAASVPQVLLRLGIARPTAATPRRPLAAVLTES